MKKNIIVHVYKSKDETFFVFEGTVFNDIEFVQKNIKSSNITFIEMDTPTESLFDHII